MIDICKNDYLGREKEIFDILKTYLDKSDDWASVQLWDTHIRYEYKRTGESFLLPINYEDWTPVAALEMIMAAVNEICRMYDKNDPKSINYVRLIAKIQNSNIDETAVIRSGVDIGWCVQIEKSVEIMNDVSIGNNVKIGYCSKVGRNTIIGGGTTIGKHCLIGNNVIIGNCSQINDGTHIWVNRKKLEGAEDGRET